MSFGQFKKLFARCFKTRPEWVNENDSLKQLGAFLLIFYMQGNGVKFNYSKMYAQSHVVTRIGIREFYDMLRFQ